VSCPTLRFPAKVLGALDLVAVCSHAIGHPKRGGAGELYRYVAVSHWMFDKSSKRFRRLQRASNRHQSHLAVALGQHYCDAHPDHAAAWLFFGRALVETARYSEARDALRRALAIAPSDRRATVLAQLGHAEASAGDFAAAENWYREAFAAAATDDEERLYLGEILFRQGKLKEAETVLRNVTGAWNESLGEAWHLLGDVLASQARHAEALACFERAVDSAPDVRKYTRRVRELRKLVRPGGTAAT
jgi:tetratricopeptide (TPR) repeat protein